MWSTVKGVGMWIRGNARGQRMGQTYDCVDTRSFFGRFTPCALAAAKVCDREPRRLVWRHLVGAQATRVARSDIWTWAKIVC